MLLYIQAVWSFLVVCFQSLVFVLMMLGCKDLHFPEYLRSISYFFWVLNYFGAETPKTNNSDQGQTIVGMFPYLI